MTEGHGNGLQIDTDRAFQERFWKVQRWAWLAMLLIIVAALAGLTGKGGALSRAEVESGSATITYPRVSRWQMADELSVEFASATGEAKVMLPMSFLDSFAVEAVTPQPSEVTAVAEGQEFTFRLGAEPGAKSVQFAVRATSPTWVSRSYAVVGDAERAPMSFVVLP